MARLSVSLLGSFQVIIDGQPIHRFRVKTAQALLAYLAVEADRPHQRETLAGLLWPDVTNAVALNHLRHALSDLRKALGPVAAATLHVTRYTLQFTHTAECALDVATFQALARTTDPGQLAQAVALYRGAFLDGFSLNSSPAFEEWLLVRQQQYVQLAVDALHQLADWHTRHGDHQAAHGYVQRLLEVDPWHEPARGLSMKLLALDGRRAEALAQYDNYRRLIDQELGVLPTPELTAQYDRLRADHLPRIPAVTANPNPSVPPPTATFVARQAELARLTSALRLARLGTGQIVLIAGEAGSGKTTLIDEFVRQALHTHAEVLAASGTCSAHTGPGEPYLPVREIVQLLTGDIEAKRASGAISAEHARRLWDSLPDTLQALIDHSPDLIGTLISAETLTLRAEVFASTASRWRTRLSQLAQRPGPTAPPADLLLQFTALFNALSHTRPLILVLDDLQWADDATLNWLSYLSRQLDGSRCLIIGAYRPADVALGRGGLRHPLAAVLNELQRHLGEIQFNLDHSAGRAFIDALLDAEPNDLSLGFRDTFFRHTGGQALFSVELLSGLKARGELVRNELGCWQAGATLNWEQLPVRVEAVVAERIDRVPDQWQPLLTAACVEGDEFTAEIIADVIGLDAASVTRALSGELSQRYQVVTATRLERHGNQRLTYYRFRHNLFERYLYQRLDVVTRARLHEMLGEALERHQIDRPTQLARHFEAAGLALKAAGYWHQAGVRALQLAAYQEAHALLTRGLQLLTDLPASPERAQCELNLQLALGQALLAQGWATADRARVFDRAFELARQTGTSIDFLQTLIALAELTQGQGEIAKSVTFGQELLRLADQASLRQHSLVAHYIIGSGRCILGQFTPACQHLEQLITSSETTSAHALISLAGMDLYAISLMWLALAHWLMADEAQSQRYYQQGLSYLQSNDQPLTLGIALTLGICPILFLRDDLSQAQIYLGWLHRLAEQALPLFRPWDKVFSGYMRVRQGDVTGLTQLRLGLAEWDASGTRGGQAHQRLLLSEACLYAGEIDAGLQTVSEALALIEATQLRMYEAELHRLQGELWLACGEVTQAIACFQCALVVAQRQGAIQWAQRAQLSLQRAKA